MHFSGLMKLFDQKLYDQYISEKYLNKDKKSQIQKKSEEISIKGTPLASLERVSDLPQGHPTREYIAARMIPPAFYEKLYHVENFKAWVNSFIPEKFENLNGDEPRVIIPFYNNKDSLI
jgi:hypothetical protein